MAVAFAVAVAIHEIIAGLIPKSTSPPAEREIVTHADIARITVHRLPTPTPPPPPKPPQVVSHSRIIAPVEPRVVARTTTGKSARREVIHRAGAARPAPPKFSNTKPIWDVVPVGAQGAGAGKTNGAGSIGTGGTGTGAGNAGTGNGAAAGTEPCGFVEFSDPHGSRYDPNTHGFWVDISLSVHYPDGHTDSVLLDYPFYYPNEAANPWSTQNIKDPTFPTRFQPPPPDKRDSEPPIVQYVMQHSDKGGFTLLKDCPQASSNP